MQNATIFWPVLSPDDTKTRSSQIAGVAALGPGRSTLQSTCSVLENLAGKFFSAVEPLKFGPRHCPQFSASAETAKQRTAALVIILHSFIIQARNPNRSCLLLNRHES